MSLVVATQTETCYRHPEEETRVHCTRCGRPICPACMTPAPVGHHCPTCVEEGDRDMRSRRLTFRRRTMSATLALIAINATVFVLEMVLPGRPLLRFGAEVPLLVAHGEYWRLLTAMFLHASIGHLVLNLFGLYLFGSLIESAFGTLRYLAIYFVTGLAASAASFAFGDPLIPAVGASGAIFGLLGAWLAFNLRRRSLSLARSNIQGALLLIGLNLLLGFMLPNIDNLAHVGGLVAGVIAGYAAEGVGRGATRGASQVGGILLILAVAAALVASRVGELSRFGPLA